MFDRGLAALQRVARSEGDNKALGIRSGGGTCDARCACSSPLGCVCGTQIEIVLFFPQVNNRFVHVDSSDEESVDLSGC